METTHLVIVDLERLCEDMAKAIPDLDCPDCCGPVYEFIENGAVVYWEELHWAYFCNCVVQRRHRHAPHDPAPQASDSQG